MADGRRPPGVAVLGLGVSTVLVLASYRFLTATDAPVINGLPWLIVVAIVAGAIRGGVLAARRQEDDTKRDAVVDTEPSTA